MISFRRTRHKLQGIGSSLCQRSCKLIPNLGIINIGFSRRILQKQTQPPIAILAGNDSRRNQPVQISQGLLRMPTERMPVNRHAGFLCRLHKIGYGSEVHRTVSPYNGRILHFIARRHFIKIGNGQAMHQLSLCKVVGSESQSQLKVGIGTVHIVLQCIIIVQIYQLSKVFRHCAPFVRQHALVCTRSQSTYRKRSQ